MSTVTPMQLSEKGGQFIRKWEDFAPKPYKDIVGVVTWGFGHARVGNEPIPKQVSLAQAMSLFDRDIEPFEAILNRALTTQLNQNQFDALMSVLYNVGPGVPGVKDGIILLKSGKHSTILTQTNLRAFDLAAAEFPKWDLAGGHPVRGLLNRRLEEKAMFQSPVL